jgi:feruloyl-CoA synthase
MVPAAWTMLADELERNDALARTLFSKLRVMQYGGAAMGQDICDRIQAVAVRTIGEKVTFSAGYGSTETGPRACSIHWHNDKAGRIGLPVPGTSVKLTPVDGKLEFRVKGPQLTMGYYGRPDLTDQAHDDEGFYIVGDAARLVDPEDPAQGMVFDGRLSENFKLATGTFVGVGALRIAVISAVGPAVTDAVVCGENRNALGLLFFPNPAVSRPDVLAAVRAGIARHNQGAAVGTRIGSVILLDGPPDAAHGEITEKGYIAQALARRLRAADVERLFAPQPDAGVLTF